jgi:hypothetical protein
MRKSHLAVALHHLGVMQDLFAQPSDSPPQNVIAALELLSGSIARLMPDRLCQEKLSELRVFARALYRKADGGGWNRSPLNEGDDLRLQILRALNALEGRIRVTGATRAPAIAGNVLPFAAGERGRRRPRPIKKASHS